MIVTVPGIMPLAIPDALPITAVATALLDQVPPIGILLKVELVPGQILSVPAMADGIGNTVTIVVATQPVGSMYVIVAVPDTIPDTTPVPVNTVATAVLLLVQIPAGVAFPSVVVWNSQTDVVPEIAAGDVFTVIGRVAIQPVGNV